MMTSNLPKELENFDIEQLAAISKNAQALIQKSKNKSCMTHMSSLSKLPKRWIALCRTF